MTGEEILKEVQQLRTWGALLSLTILFGWETFFPFIREFKGGVRFRLGHAVRNLTFAFCNFLIGAVLFGGTWAVVSLWAAEGGYGILHWLDLGFYGHVVGAIILWDFWTYWWHRWNHEVPFLWRFHQVHHSDPEMDVTTAYRFHMGEIILSSCLRIPLIVLFGSHFWELVLYEFLLFLVVQFHHANIDVGQRVDQVLRLVIPSPYMHKIHHSTTPSEFNTNYTSLFSVWDRVFGSFKMRKDPENIRFGLTEQADADSQRVLALIQSPFKV